GGYAIRDAQSPAAAAGAGPASVRLMLPGFGGHLISEHFLERHLGQGVAVEPTAATRAAFRRWRERQHVLGPASSVRAMLETGATPLLRVLGFTALSEARLSEDLASATLRVGDLTIVLVVARWGDRLDPLWRRSIIEAQQRRAAWCVLFNGTHLRLIHTTRVFS